jgi:hypothetical protein
MEIDQANLIADFISKKKTKIKLPTKLSSAERGQQYRARQRQKKLNSSANNLMIENNEQNLTPVKSSSTDAIPTSNFSKQNEQQLSTNLLSPPSNISNFNLLHLTNSTTGKIIDHNQNLPSGSIFPYGASADLDLESIKQSDGNLTGIKIIEKSIIIICNKCNKHLF